MKKRLIAVHLLNDHSGSPLVLRQSLEALRHSYVITLYTATPGGKGLLSDLPGIDYRTVFYRRSGNRWMTLAVYLVSQLLLFRSLLLQLRKNDVVYINTLLPFGAALAARLRGCRIIYHIHETSLKPYLLKSFLSQVAGLTADRVLFVSRYVAAQYHFPRIETTVIHNSVPDDFADAARRIARADQDGTFTVTMLCSLKSYKGIHEFVSVAGKLPRLAFELVLNASEHETARFIRDVRPPANCRIFAAQRDTLPFYERAHIVLNLSRPDGWVETFGMTLLEAMCCGRPVICPCAGGVLELVTDGAEGYTIDSGDEAAVCAALDRLSRDRLLYRRLAEAAGRRAQHFSAAAFRQKLAAALAATAGSGQRKNRQPFFREMENKIL